MSYWVRPDGRANEVADSLDKTRLAEELRKKTGINVQFIHPKSGQELQQLSVLIASGKCPDIIESDWYDFAGGPEKSIREGYILRLNSIIDNYAPNFKSYLKSRPDVDKIARTESGSYYAFPFIRGDEALYVYYGPMLRKDWLDECGLDVPETISDWYHVLKAFKEVKNAEAPLAVNSGVSYSISAFCGAFGVMPEIYVDNGQVKYGPMEKGYVDFLKEMSKWYREGLIDPLFASSNSETASYNILNGKSGAVFELAGASMGVWLDKRFGKDKFDLVGAPYPVLNKGEKPMFGQQDWPCLPNKSAAITSNCKNVEEAARFLDFGYSPEGMMTYNFGVEGESYTMENGSPKYKDVVNKNSKYPISTAMAQYTRAFASGPFIQMKEYAMEYYLYPQQKKALEVWRNNDAEQHMLPYLNFSLEESGKIEKYYNTINSFNKEMRLKFIMGVEPIERYDEFVQTLKNMKIDEVLGIYQNAYDRYLKK